MSAEIDAIIDRYLEHPEDPDTWAAASTPEGFAFMIRRCLAVVDSNPSEGLPLLDLAFRIVTSSCDVVQTLGLTAAAHRLLGKSRQAGQVLERAFEIGASCPSCQADLHRRRAKVRASSGMIDGAFADADRSIQLYRALDGHDHDLHGNGLAKAHLARADVRYFIGSETKDPPLLSAAVADVETALGVIVPGETPELYSLALFNLAVALYATGDPEDLARSHGYLSQARRRMGSSTSKPSQERGKLAWVTAMVEHELIAHRRVLPREVVLGMNRRGVRPVRVRRKLEDAVSDFVKVAMPQEASACASDHAKILLHKAEPDPDYGAVRELVSGVLERIERRFELPDVAVRVAELEPLRRAVDRLVDACDPARWDVYFRVRKAIDGLRAAAGPGMITCLIRWRDV